VAENPQSNLVASNKVAAWHPKREHSGAITCLIVKFDVDNVMIWKAAVASHTTDRSCHKFHGYSFQSEFQPSKTGFFAWIG
jgi:hypothetical protein